MVEYIIKFITTKQIYGTIAVLGLSYIIYKILPNILKNIVIKGKDALEVKRKKTIIILFNNILKYVIIIVTLLMLLNLYGVDTTSLLAGLGIAGVVIGLGLQDALKDIISGINIIMDNYFVVGDVVTYNDFTGIITEFGLKTTKIKKSTGEVLIIANRNIDKIINISQEKGTIIINIPTAYEEKSDKIEKVLTDLLESIKEKYSDIVETEYLGVDSLEDSSVNYSIKITCVRGTHWDIKRKVLKDIKEAYEKNKIKIPYNQLEVHNGKDI